MARRMRIEDLNQFAVPEQPALSPDGSQVVYVLRTVDQAGDRIARTLWGVGVRTGEPRQLSAGDRDTDPTWAPDGSRIAFLRSCDGAQQLWTLPAHGGEATRLTALPLGAGKPEWSPDGKVLAFTAPVGVAPADAGADRRPIEANRLNYQADGAGMFGSTRSHLHLLELATGEVRQVTHGDWHASVPAWSPDGSRIAFTARMEDDSDLTLCSDVYLLDVDDLSSPPTRIGPGAWYLGPLCWSADSAALLVVASITSLDGPAGLFRLPLDGDEIVELAEQLDRNVMPGGPAYPGGRPQLIEDGRSLLFCARDRGCTHLFVLDLEGGTARAVLAGPDVTVAGLSARGQSIAVVLMTPASFGEIAVLDLATGTPRVRTDHGVNASELDYLVRTERNFTISDSTTVQGWLLRDPAVIGPTPLLLDIHGGPHNAWSGMADPTHLYHQELAARGWTILVLNPRGSDGYGAEFFNAIVGAWGEADLLDLLEPLDELVAEGIADPARLAVTGYSYGGFMTCNLTSRDSRFAAAIAGGVVSDLSSFAGSSDEGRLVSDYEMGVASWADRARYAELSPISRVERVDTPTLILHGAADLRCPVGQAQQWFTALRERGVPTRLVLYPGASHLFLEEGLPSHLLDYNRRVLDWAERYVGSQSGRRIDAEHWQRRLAALAEQHGVPGATLGILRLRPGGCDEQAEVAYGVLNKDTGAPVNTNSLFQIGSMTKVWTATVVLQLVDEGLLDLDAPIIDLLPELRLSDQRTTEQVTMRHLLTHTSGIDGDVFTDTGRNDDCLQRYVELLERVGQNHPLGDNWSYCNSGFSLIGRVIERITGKTWDRAMADRLFTPLGLTHTVTLPEQALLHGAAVGHFVDDDGAPVRVPIWSLPRSSGPAGAINSTVGDVLTWARLHLDGGLTSDGSRLLGQASVSAMMARQVGLPEGYAFGESWGLAWMRFDWDGNEVIGHDGNTIGQLAFLRLVPELGFAVTLLTNGRNARDLYQDLFREVLAELADIRMPPAIQPPAEPPDVDLSCHLGTYERAGERIEILVQDGVTVLRQIETGELAELAPETPHDLVMVPMDASGCLFAVRPPRVRTWSPVLFYSLSTGERYLHYQLRATPKTG